MNNSLQKVEWENTTRMLYFKYRGDLVKILTELRAKYEDEVDNVNERLTVVFVKNVIKKFKREQKANDPYVATNIMQYVLMGTKQREILWDIDDELLEEYKFSYWSACCNAATDQRINDKEETHYLCLKCEKICNVYRKPNLDIFALKKQIRIEKRKDEAQLVRAVDSLGFGAEKAPILKETKYQVVLQGGSRPRKKIASLTREDQDFVSDIQKLPPMDREVVIGKLRRRMATIDREELEIIDNDK